MVARRRTVLGCLCLVLLAGVARSSAQLVPSAGARRDTLPEPMLVELHLDRIATRTVPAFRVRTEVLVPLTQFLQLAEVRYRVSAGGRLEATVDPGGIPLVVDVQRDTMEFGTRRVRLEPEYRLFQDGELYVGAERLGDLLGSPLQVDWVELTVTMIDPSVLPVARRLKRAAAREALLQPREWARPDLTLGADRPRWDGLVFDYSLLAPSAEPIAGSGYTAALGADAFGGSLELNVASVGRAADGVARIQGSWTGVWRDSRWVQQLRFGDGLSTGPRPRALRGFSVTNAPFVRPSLLGTVRFDGELEPGGGWALEAYRGGQLVAFDSADAAGRFAIALPVRYGENPVEFVAYGPFGEVRAFSRTYQVISELLPAHRFEYGLSGGSCPTTVCGATGNVDLRYGAAAGWTVQAGLDQFWRDTLPDLAHVYAAVAGTPTNWGAVILEGVSRALVRGGLRYEPSVNLRVTADYTRFHGDAAPIITAVGARSQLGWMAFVRPLPRAGFFYFLGSFDRRTTDVGTTTTARLETSAQGRELRLIPYVRVERDAPRGAAAATRPFLGLNTFVLPQPGLGKILGQVWMRGGAEVETDGAPRLSSYSLVAARPLGSALRLEAGVTWLRGAPGASFTLTLTSYLSMVRSYTTVTAPAGAAVTGSQYVQGSLLWDRATGRLATAPGPSLERSGVSGRVFLDENGNGLADPGEPPVPGVRVRVGVNTAVSDSSGVFRVWDVVPFEPVTVQVDSASLPSPLLVPAFGSALIEPGPNRFRGLDIPLVQAGVIEGRVTRDVGGRLEGVPGVTVVLTDRKTGTRRLIVTFSDGDFYALGVKPGDYDLAVEPAALDALGAQAAPLHLALRPTAAGVGASELELRLTPKP